jgi:predicted helicase
LNYEKLEPWKLKWIENPDEPLSYRVEKKMKLVKPKQKEPSSPPSPGVPGEGGSSLVVNESLTLADIPPQVYEYRLGNRSALEWVIDQYQVSKDKRSGIVSDPNREDDPEYIVRLVGQVVRVSVETVRIVKGLPDKFV